MASSLGDLCRPGGGRLGHCLQMIGHQEARHRLARPKIVVAVLQPEDFYGLRKLVGRDLFLRAERIARSLDDQRRRLERGEMGSTQLCGLADRMERIAEAEQTG